MGFPKQFETATETYLRDEALGEGGAGVVFRVKDSAGEFFALKVLKAALRSRSKGKRFRNEIAFLRSVTHDHIVPVLDSGIVVAGDSEASPFFVMPFYSSTLRKEMSRRRPIGQLDPIRALKLFDGLLSGVEAAHLKSVVHRDLKPENILVDQKNDRLVVADFGIARFSEEASLATFVETSEGERLASWRYAAPEQKTGGAEVDHRADIYALGLMLGEVFTGEVPEGTSPVRIGAKVPSHGYLDDVVDSLRRTRPDERPATIRDVKGLLLSKGNEFISLQKLSRVENTAVPAATVDDPLVSDPPELVGVTVVPGGGSFEIVFELTRPVTEEWNRVLQGSPIGYSMNYPPSRFRFEGKKARSPLYNSAEAQLVTDHFKSWLDQMKLHYRRHAEELARRKADSERASLASAKRLEEELLRINKSLKI